MHPILLVIAGAGLVIAGLQAISEDSAPEPKKPARKKRKKKVAKSVPIADNSTVPSPEVIEHEQIVAPNPDRVDDIGNSGDGVTPAD